MEAEKSQGLFSVGWRPKKTHGGIRSKPRGLRTREADGVSLSAPAGKDDASAQQSGRRGMNSPFFHPLFYLGPRQKGGIGRCPLTSGGHSALLCPLM